MNENISNFRPVWSLRNKILISMTALILLFGLSAALTIRMILLGVLKTEFQHRGLSSARSIAANSVVDVLTQNTSRLNKLVENEKKLDTDTAYAFIVDSSGRILAHTFQNGFPIGLLNANAIAKNKDFNMQTLGTQLGFIYDIDVPIFLDKSVIGQVRLGILRSRIQKTIALIDSAILIVMLLIVIINILLANKISALITRPISRLVEAVQSIQRGDTSTRITDMGRDEIGFLTGTFNEMAAYLKQLINEKEKFAKYSERGKIALDLHDNCAQDLANLIKRLELCEKLFKIEPEKAIEELKALKASISGHLSKARQIIHGLKDSTEGEKFILAQRLKEYIEEFKQYNEVNIKLNLTESLNSDIAEDKARDIFYIITEALTNIKKHAQAKNIDISLDCNERNELAIDIKDDGKGFDLKEAQVCASGFGKWGLISMRQRAISLGGAFAINSVLGEGSEISFRVPLSVLEYNI